MELMMNNQAEIDFLLKHVKDKDVLEWGSGGSTREIARLCNSLVSIENSDVWFKDVAIELHDDWVHSRYITSTHFSNKKHLNYYLILKNKEEEVGHDGTLQDYFDYVNFPLVLNKKFDTIFIDGRARVECAKVAVKLLKPGGIILIHDYRNPTEQYRRYEYEVVEKFLDCIEGEYALYAFRPKFQWILNGKPLLMNIFPNKLNIQMTQQTNLLTEESKTMCWYADYCIDEMNRAYAQNIRGKEELVAAEYPTKGYINLLNLVDKTKGNKLLDIGTGTAMIADFSPGFNFHGADLPKILAGCALYWKPQFWYKGCDVLQDDISWIKEFDVVVCNGFIDVMQNALQVFKKVLQHTGKYLLLHRQEITEAGITREIVNASYGGNTFHSIISRSDFKALLEEMNFEIVAEEKLAFGNWENGGRSFLLRKRKSWALDGIDHYLNEKYFAQKSGGCFFEAGANDGLRQSNTKFFEHYKGWMGILVEPVTEQYHQLRGNRSVTNINVYAALVAPEYNNENIDIVYTSDNYGLMSVINDENAEGLLTRIGTEKRQVLSVPAMTINSILAKCWNPDIPIDLMILDLEGYELKALKGIDFSSWQVEYLLIEILDKDSSSISEILSEQYELLEVIGEHNYFYKRKIYLT